MKRFRLSRHYESMKRIVALLAFALPLAAQPLKVVTVSAPAVNFVFNPTGVITVSDKTSPVFAPGFLQSRTFQGASGAPAAGLYVYEYRIDLRNSVGITSIPFVSSMTVSFGPNVPLDFDKDGKPDDVFVITKGGLGNIGVASATRLNASEIKFVFNPPVAGGASAGKGDSTFFFGLVSKTHSANMGVVMTATPGGFLCPTASLPASKFAPGCPVAPPPAPPLKKP